MWVEQAVVEQIVDGGVWVSTNTSTTCSSCQQQEHCSSGIVAKALPVRRQRLFVPTEELLLTGQNIEIAIEGSAVLQSALWVYLAPVFALFLGMLALAETGVGEPFQLLGGVLCAMLMLAGVSRLERRRHDQLQVRIHRLLAVPCAISPEKSR